jgi:hypothetical protein
MMFGVAVETRPPLVTVPEFLFMVALLAGIIVLVLSGLRRWKHRSTDGASGSSSNDPV